MAFQRKTLIRLLVIAVIAIVAAIIIYLFRCDIFRNLNSCVEDPNEDGTPVPPGSGSTKWVAETPPYNVGMFGPKIKALQAAMGITADGRFGQQTRGTIVSKGYNVPLSEADYNTLVSSGGTPAGSIVGKEARAKGTGLTSVFLNDSPANPTFLKFVSKDGLVGIVKSSLDDTWYLLNGDTKVKKVEVYLV